jgi:hypothetical protein
MEAATADISSELFGQGDEEENVEPIEGEEASLPTVMRPPTMRRRPLPNRKQRKGVIKPPRSRRELGRGSSRWRAKDLDEGSCQAWAQFPMVPRSSALNRKLLSVKRTFSTVLRNIRAWLRRVRLMKPLSRRMHRSWLRKNVDPVQMFQSFASNHYLLSRGTDAQKVDIAAALFKGYKIPLVDFLNHFAEHWWGATG